MKIGILGGGMMGFTMGYRLSKLGHEVTILEASTQPGGLSTWANFGDFTWDKYYHVILKSDASLLRLIDELKLTDKMHWAPTKTGFLWQGKHVSMSNGLEFLTFPPLNLIDKARLGFGILYNYSIKDPKKLNGKTATTWLRSVFGNKVYETIWDPLLESKFGSLKDRIPAHLIWSTLRRYSSTRSPDGREWMGHLKGGGLKILFDALTPYMKEIICSAKVIGIEHGEKVRVKTDSTTYEFDRLVSTIPTALLQKIAPQINNLYPSTPPPYFLGVIRLALVLKRSLSPYYVTNLIDKGLPFTGIIEVSQLGEKWEFADHDFVMIPRYDVPSSEWFQKSDDEIKKAFIDALRKNWSDIDDNIIASFVNREKIVQPLWIDSPRPEGKVTRTPDLKIWNVNNQLASHSTLNNNSIVEVADEVMAEWE